MADTTKVDQLTQGLNIIEAELQHWGRGNGYTVMRSPMCLPKHFTLRILLRLIGIEKITP